MTATTFIYALCEPGTRTVRYVGKANNPKRRLVNHLAVAKLGVKRSHTLHWLRRLLSKGEKPELFILGEIPRLGWEAYEINAIAAARALGMGVTNTTDGGEGVAGVKGQKHWMFGKKHTPETKAKISKVKTGRKATLEAKANQAKAQLGRKHPAEVKAKISKAQNTSGFNGVSKLCGKWRVAIDRKCLGYFSKIEDAVFVRTLYLALERNQRLSRANRSGYKGVDWKSDIKHFRARITVAEKTLELGRFRQAIDAAVAYDQAAQIYFGESARLNFSYDPACFI